MFAAGAFARDKNPSANTRWADNGRLTMDPFKIFDGGSSKTCCFCGVLVISLQSSIKINSFDQPVTKTNPRLHRFNPWVLCFNERSGTVLNKESRKKRFHSWLQFLFLLLGERHTDKALPEIIKFHWNVHARSTSSSGQGHLTITKLPTRYGSA